MIDSKKGEIIFFFLVWVKLFAFQICENGGHVFGRLIYYGSIKFNGENYVNWKFKLITILAALDLLPIVKGDQQNPTNPLSIAD